MNVASAVMPTAREIPMHLIDMLRIADAESASDLHLVPDHPPMLRVNTLMEPVDQPMLSRGGCPGGIRGDDLAECSGSDLKSSRIWICPTRSRDSAGTGSMHIASGARSP